MPDVMIQDRGRGPEIEHTRITIDVLIPYFMDPALTEASIGRLYGLSPEQVASARAYLLAQPEILDRHLQLQDRLDPVNPPEVIEQAKRTRAALVGFREWIGRRPEEGAANRSLAPDLLSFKTWLAAQEAEVGAKP